MKSLHNRKLQLHLVLGFLLLLWGPLRTLAVEFKPAQTLPGAELFTNDGVRQIQIEMDASRVERP